MPKQIETETIRVQKYFPENSSTYYDNVKVGRVTLPKAPWKTDDETEMVKVKL